MDTDQLFVGGAVAAILALIIAILTYNMHNMNHELNMAKAGYVQVYVHGTGRSVWVRADAPATPVVEK